MESSVAIVAKQQLVVVLRRRAKRARLTFDALPFVTLGRDDHVVGELKASRMPRSATLRARNHRFGLVRLLVIRLVTQTEVAVLRQQRWRRGSGSGDAGSCRCRWWRRQLSRGLGKFRRDIGE